MRHSVRYSTAALLLAGAAAASGASAATPTTETLYARQEGCGATQEAGRLETSRGTDGADGCGTIGGLPVNEAIGAAPETYSTGETYKGVKVRADKVVGQVAADSWVGVVGGVGTVEVDVTMSGIAQDGETVVDLGSTTVTAPASPTTATVKIPFELAVPAESAGLTVTSWSLSVTLRGQNVNANAQALDGDVLVKLPILR